MIYAVWVPVLVGLLLPAAARLVARQAHPAVAVWWLMLLSVGGAVSWVCSFLLLSATAPLASGAWGSDRDPVPLWVAGVAVPAALALSVAGARAASRQWRALKVVDRAFAHSRDRHAVFLVDQGVPRAEAWCGLRAGGIVVSQPLMAHLDDQEQSALLAHEHAHVRARHSWMRSACATAAAVHPGLRHVPGLLEVACERAADEVAARAVGQRSAVARAIARASLFVVRTDAASGAVSGFAGSSTVCRIEALLVAAPRRLRGATVLAAVAALVVVAVSCGVHATGDYWGLWVAG